MTPLIDFPCSAIPRLKTHAYSVLLMLFEGNKKTSELTIGLGGKNPRSALQSLMNGDSDYWNIINIGIQGSNEGCYQLDPRHRSGDIELDKQARTERFLDLLREQKNKNQQAANKLPDSIERWQEAESSFSPQLKLPLIKNKKTA